MFNELVEINMVFREIFIDKKSKTKKGLFIK